MDFYCPISLSTSAILLLLARGVRRVIAIAATAFPVVQMKISFLAYYLTNVGNRILKIWSIT